MKSFFKDESSETWKPEAYEFDRELRDAIEPVLKKWLAAGYRTRELEPMVTWCAWEMLVSHRLGLEIEEQRRLRELGQS